MRDLSSSGIRLGIIGTNFISDSLLDAAKRCGLAVTAVYSRKAETGEAFAKKHGIPSVYCDFDEFCASDEFCAAYVASPNFCHFPQSMTLLSHGKHVLAEKPAATSLCEFLTLRDTAKKNRLVFLEAMRPDFDPSIEIIRQALPKCGALRSAHFEYSQYSSRYDKFKNGIIENAFRPELSNAALMDIGVYPIHVCMNLFGRPEEIRSCSVMLENSFEGQGDVILCYPDMTATVRYSKITEAAQSSFIRGEAGELIFGKALSKVSEISFCPRGGKPEELGFVPHENNMVYELCAFADFVMGKESNEKYLDITADTLFVMDEIRRQNRIVFPSDNNRI